MASCEDPLKKYVCLHPYMYLDAQTSLAWICCPSWAPTPIADYSNSEALVSGAIHLEDAWFEGETVNKIRESVANGSYEYCSKINCPQLNQLAHSGKNPGFPFVLKEDFEKMSFNGPEKILFGFDRSCNLKCPSCRGDVIINDKEDTIEHQCKVEILNQIEESFSESAKTLMITGSGDPFYSKLYRDYLINFDETKYPNLERINIVTNGNLLSPKMWRSLKAKKFIKSIEISVDAGTKDTYENTTRLNGDWDRLISNIKFLADQPEIEQFIISMVVSQYNYKEMKDMYDVFSPIFKNAKNTHNEWCIKYTRIVHWETGAYHPDDIRNISVFDKEHPNHEDFLQCLNSVVNLNNVHHGFYELLND